MSSSLPPLAAARAGAAVAIGPDTTGEGRPEQDHFDQEAPASGGLAAARSGVPYPIFPVPDDPDGAGASLPDADQIPRANYRAEKVRARKRGALVGAALLVAICVAVLVSVTYYGPKDELTEGASTSSSVGGGGGGPSRPKPPVVDEDDSDDGETGGDDDASRLKDARAYIEHFGISDPITLDSAATPQRRAMEWIALSDPARISIPVSFAEDVVDKSAGMRFDQRYSLAVIYFALGGSMEEEEADGDSDLGWKTDLNFLSGDVECDWNEKFQTLGGDTVYLGAICDWWEDLGIEVRRVTKLWIPWEHGLAGTLPPEIRHLTHLKSISMAYQGIDGTIPPGVCFLDKLEEFSLSNNFVSGPLPECMKNMKALRILAMDDNSLSGDLDVVNKMTSLQFLYLEDNEFEDVTLDNDSFKDLKELVHLDLSDNDFEGVVPEHLFSHPTLRVLDLHDNELTGPLPDTIEEQDKLEFLALHKNNLNGTIEDSLGNLTSLVYLDLAYNQFTGSLTHEYWGLAKLKGLKYLFLGGNLYDYQIFPPFVEGMTDLLELSLKDSGIKGEIPSWIGSLTNLYLLDLDDNLLEKNIPSEMGNLSNLMYLLLNRNNLSGEIPPELSSLVNLKLALLDDNSFVGSLDDTLCPALSDDAQVSADCGGNTPEVACTDDCCQVCCEDGDETCNDDEWIANNDPIWEHRYGRYRFAFEDGPRGSESIPDEEP